VYEVIDSRLYIVNRPKSISALLIYNIKKELSRDSPKVTTGKYPHEIHG